MKTFEQVKKHSETYAKMMRDLFSWSFENEKLNDILYNITLDDEKTLFAKKIMSDETLKIWFKNFVYSKINVETDVIDTNKTVRELLEEVWYDFYICKTVKDVEKFRKYYKQGEELCTFNDIKWRLKSYHIFWIVKKDIDKIEHQWDRRHRQDIYGTSCCSIQIHKENNRDLSIKNRYNHTVNNPDCTYNNNLDNIVPWLTRAFEREFNLNFGDIRWLWTFEVPEFIYKNDKFMWFNYERNNVYHWKNKIYKNGEYIIFNPDRYILVNMFLIDLQNKKIETLAPYVEDWFLDLKFDKIVVRNKKDFDKDEDEPNTLILYR
jgi:hypothetical protein